VERPKDEVRGAQDQGPGFSFLPVPRLRSWLAAIAITALASLLVPGIWDTSGNSQPHWFSPGAHAQEQIGPAAANASEGTAYLVQVPLPIEENVDAQVKSRVQLVLKSLEDAAPAKDASKRPVLILEFRSSSGNEGETSSFGRSLELAQFLTSEALNRVRTVAYLPQSVKGHAVLPVLACEAIVMAKDAEIGEAGHLADTVTEAAITNYVEIARRRHTIPDAIARGFVDSKAAVLQITTADGVRYETAAGRDALQKEGKIVRETTVFEPGEPHKLIGVQMRDFGFAIHKAENRRELAAALELPHNSLRENLAPEEGWKPILVSLEGPVTQRGVTWIIKSLEGHVQREDFNLLVLHVNSTGGDPEQSLRLARKLADLDDRYHSVSVVDLRALGDAALVAWGADELLVSERADLGGSGETVIDENLLATIRDPLKQLAQLRDREWSLPLALVDPRVEVYPYLRGDGEKRYLTSEEVQEFRDPEQWQRSGEPLRTSRGIDGATAVELGFAQGTIHNLEELKSRYGVKELSPLRPNWALEFVEWLADPRLAALLLFVGWFALMIELSSPGLGVPGFISAICFMLYFWSQFLHGTAHWLEILLFLTGAMFVAVEIFILPGFGVFGIGGGMMIILSIILASQTFIIPGNEYQMRQFPISLLLVAAGASGAVVSVYVIRRFLPHTPYFNRMLLAPPEGEELQELSRRESLVFYDHLTGKYGIATTPLVPSGKARFGDELVDVISDGELIPKGTPVYVAEVIGNRVLVKAVVT
jgi:membrane-bound serine protease (ClpP class)